MPLFMRSGTKVSTPGSAIVLAWQAFTVPFRLVDEI